MANSGNRDITSSNSANAETDDTEETFAKINKIIAEYDSRKGWLKKNWLSQGPGSRSVVLEIIVAMAQRKDLANIKAILKSLMPTLDEHGDKRTWDNTFSQTQVALIKLDFLLNNGQGFAAFFASSKSTKIHSGELVIFLAKLNRLQDVIAYFNIGDSYDINKKEKAVHKNTALHWAVMNNSCDSAIALINHNNINLSIVDYDQKNVLHMVILKGREHLGNVTNQLHRKIGTDLKATMNDVMIALLAHPDIPKIINMPLPDGNTPLHLAYMRKDDALIKKLIELGADLNCRNNENKKPAELANLPKDIVLNYLIAKTSAATLSGTKPKL